MFKKFVKNIRGNVAVSFALASIALVGIGGGVIDYASQSSTKAQLQGVADAAVLVAANQLKLSGSKKSQASTVDTVAQAYVKHNLDAAIDNPKVDVTVSIKQGTVDLKLSGDLQTSFLSMLGLNSVQKISATARAQILGGLPLCVLSLDEADQKALTATNKAKLTATGCTVHSNSISPNGIEAWGSALLQTGLTCSTGGAVGGNGNYIPVAVQDCPAISDPLQNRTVPTIGSCDYNNLEVNSGNQTLSPGTYCGGLKLTGNSTVLFSPGVYIIKDGKFEITGNAKANGTHVGFYFTGPNAFYGFHGQAEVNLSAPATGDMAGLLFFEDPTRTRSYTYEITSVNTKSLVGTIYLPKSEMAVSVNAAGNNSVAQESAFTVIVARRVVLTGKSNLVLNTDFAATDVPVPESIARLSGQIVIAK